MADTPNPGSDEALAIGCLCPVLDNNHGRGFPWPRGESFWINGDCPIHGLAAGASREGSQPPSTARVPPVPAPRRTA